ncbi:MAG: hypothetical protein EBR82_00540 [Caulobacteraceae bacterium]|nr:hypothetical protein [Caulobacteraceae bacterium]
MNEQFTYGELQSEKLTTESNIARQIVKEINTFGINDRQRWLIMYYLSLELETVEDMKELSSFIREKKGNSLFVTKIYGQEEDNG